MGHSNEQFIEQRQNEDLQKKNVDLFKVLSNIKDMALNGVISPLEAFKKIKDVEDYSKQLRDELLDSAFDETENYKNQSFDGYNIKTSYRPIYDFSHIERHKELSKEIKEIEKQAKEICKINNGNDIVDMDSGEVKISARIKSKSKILTFEKAK